MRKPIPTFVALCLGVACLGSAISGCGVIYRQPIYQGSLLDASAVEQLQVGMSKQQVEALLGSPSIADPFHHDRWDYTASQRVERVGAPVIKNFVVYFQDDAVTRWEGDYFPEQDIELAKRMARWGNLAKDDKKK